MKRQFASLLPVLTGGALSLLVVLALPVVTFAQQSSSTNYQVNEAFFGNGGELNACSTSYCAKQAAGETAVGNTSSTNYQSQAGFNTEREEYLEFTVNSSNTSFGPLTPGGINTTTGTFSVKAYLASGYSVVNASDPPTSSGVNAHPIAPMTTTAARSSTTEQFGINLVANTSPVTFGANAVQSPSGTFSFGAAASGYATTNQFRYNKGEVIASSTKSSGTTSYTVAYMINVINRTPAGHYTFNHVMVATGTY